jgi:DNA repair exonuclease SbcCD nuclease subunit
MFRFLHLADLHIGLKPRFLGEKAESRRKDFESALSRAADYAVDPENSISMVLIAGDLFDRHAPAEAEVAFVGGQIQKLVGAGLDVVIVPGTHDSLAYANSVFRRDVFAGALVVRNPAFERVATFDVPGGPAIIYSAASQFGAQQRPLEGFARPAEPDIHIGVLHASVEGNPEWTRGSKDMLVSEDEIAASRLHYLALGHYHNFHAYNCGETLAVYPGTLEGRKFGENGPRHLVTVTIRDGVCTTEHVPFNARKLDELVLDLETRGVCSNDDVIAELNALADPNMLLRCTLKGTVDFSVDTVRIRSAVEEKFFHIELLDNTSVFESRWVSQFVGENTVRGIFVRQVLERIEHAQDEKEKAVLNEALKIGLARLVAAQSNESP